mgnify:CR=1 FL=1
MAIARWMWFIILLLAVYFVVAPWVGVTGTLAVIAFALALALTLDYFKVFRVFPFRLKKNIALILMLGLWGYTAFSAGWLAKLGLQLPTGAIQAGVKPPAEPGACVVSEELKGKTATITVNAWDMESNTPYSSAVDVNPTYVFKNGNSAENYVKELSDTSAYSLSGFAVGDTLYAYGGGTSYYADPVEGWCVDSQAPTLSINAHAIASESNMQITGYDDTGSATLSAGTTNEDDYYITMGAGEEQAIYLKLKVNAANKAYQFCAWGVATFYNISSVEPQNVEATYTKIATPEHLESVAIKVNETSPATTITEDYTVYKASSPIMLHEWDSIKEQFVVKSDSSNDPVGNGGTSSLNGFAIIAKDCAYARGDDGRVYLDLYQHDSAESDVGLDETETSPYGKQVGVVIEVR